MHNLPFPKSHFTASVPFELIHSDLWGPAPLNSINGFKYYVLFIDHFTRFTWLYLLKSKSEVFAKFVRFKAMIENQFSAKIKIFRSDGGVNTLPLSSNLTYCSKVLLTMFHVHILLNRMALLKENTGTSLKPLSLFFHKPQ